MKLNKFAPAVDPFAATNASSEAVSSPRKDEILQLNNFAFEQVNDMIFWINEEGRFLYVNQAVINAHGRTEEELLQLYVWDIAPRVDPKQWSARWTRLITQKTIRYASVHRRKDGSEFPVDVKLSTIIFAGQPLLCAILRDISELALKEQQLAVALAEIQQIKGQLEAENNFLLEDIKLKYNYDEIIGSSRAYKKVLRQVEQLAPTDTTALILGETGTGKELIARLIHKLSPRKEERLVKINCAALPENLVESELFGHRKGAFTGAEYKRIGKFELASSGTIFLDEIGELSPAIQAKLLRVLQDGEFCPLGSNEVLHSGARIIAATNRDLKELVKTGKFRSDLLYRLNVFPIQNPPLRKRKEDIPLLVNYFLTKYTQKTGKLINGISETALDRLQDYYYPGNIRELENIIERAVIICESSVIQPRHLMISPNGQVANTKGPFLSLEASQTKHILAALHHTKWQVSGPGGAAVLLNLNPKTLDSKMRRFGIRRPKVTS